MEREDLKEKKTFASYVVESLTFEPDSGRWVDVRLRLILGEEEVLRVPRRGRGGRGSTGLDTLSRAELTTAWYYIHGYSEMEMAKDRDVMVTSVRDHRGSLIRRTGATSLEEALAMVAPLVEARIDELLVGQRRGPRFADIFTNAQLNVLSLLSERLSTRQIAERMGRTQSTIGGHLARLYRKLGVGKAADAVREAQRRHLIGGPTPWSSCPTRRQLDVLKRLALGDSQPQTAVHLGISLSAVKERMKCMFGKFGVKTQAHLLALARERGWLQ